VSAADEHGGSAGVPQSTALMLQCFLSVAGTMVGEALGDTLPEKLAGGLLLCVIGAFLSAPGRHHRRRVLAVALLLALLESLRRAAGALASPGRRRPRAASAPGALTPASWATVGIAAVAGLAIGSVGTAATGGWSEDRVSTTVSVPAVAGRSEAGARLALEGAGLTAVRAGARSVSVRRGVAIRTAPAAGASVRSGSSVTLFVSTGPPPAQFAIPAVRGLPEREARALLADLGLRVSRRDAPSEQIARGTATGTSAVADTRVRRGSRVTLLVSSGRPGDERVVVPSVEGRAQRAALALLRDVGLDPVLRPTPSEDVPEGIAIGTDPAAGGRVDRGARVRLLVSSGSAVERVDVPSLVGNAAKVARARLDEVGLTSELRTEDSSEPRGRVIRSDPAAGTAVPVGSTVVLVVSSGTLVRVPDVVGQPVASAGSSLKSAGLGWTEKDVPSSEAQGIVTRTDPAPGSEVARGTNVDVYVSCGPTACID
jgi:beta-lactam-binding protein with PASTA domain